MRGMFALKDCKRICIKGEKNYKIKAKFEVSIIKI